MSSKKLMLILSILWSVSSLIIASPLTIRLPDGYQGPLPVYQQQPPTKWERFSGWIAQSKQWAPEIALAAVTAGSILLIVYRKDIAELIEKAYC